MRKPSRITKPQPGAKRAEKRAGSPPSPRKRSAGGPGTSAVAEAAALPVPLPAPGEGKRGEQGYLGYLLRQAQAAVRLSMERALADLGVTSPQFGVLTMLNAYPGLSGADVARLTFLTPQTVGVIISNLERDGAIRKAPHPVHGRILQWTLTPRGATLLAACRERVLALEQRLAAGLDGKAETTIRRWLAKVATELQENN
jgi:DNA-binding MarR family transcriptional regulator